MTATNSNGAVLLPEQIKYFIAKVLDRKLAFHERANYKHILDEIKRNVDLAIIDFERDTLIFKPKRN
jgi:hypothetical protein